MFGEQVSVLALVLVLVQRKRKSTWDKWIKGNKTLTPNIKMVGEVYEALNG
jgi:hypothetical protein